MGPRCPCRTFSIAHRSVISGKSCRIVQHEGRIATAEFPVHSGQPCVLAAQLSVAEKEGEVEGSLLWSAERHTCHGRHVCCSKFLLRDLSGCVDRKERQNSESHRLEISLATYEVDE